MSEHYGPATRVQKIMTSKLPVSKNKKNTAEQTGLKYMHYTAYTNAH